ncbi:hypothetical protein [Janthinobacterium sp. PC23-8]|uniref:hypothetical protein n=1 Tax=Janthinobacterium sp. PC23-8 TaxID=2012679 RepID=UPI000B95E2AD|nr:hypothetical protein [Janthinobacterium sp. PC23-8]OYO29902.1 hypothetical protein CD932_01170 [Janthinobacterium sp. PC23-8]
MNPRHPLDAILILRHPRRFWLTSLAIALICAIVLAPWLASSPWLVAIPLVVGGLLVALGELWEELRGQPLQGDRNDPATPCRRP